MYVSISIVMSTVAADCSASVVDSGLPDIPSTPAVIKTEALVVLERSNMTARTVRATVTLGHAACAFGHVTGCVTEKG